MSIAFLVLFWLALTVLLGVRLFAMVVDAAMFLFPCGLIGLVMLGVALLFLLTPRHRVD